MMNIKYKWLNHRFWLGIYSDERFYFLSNNNLCTKKMIFGKNLNCIFLKKKPLWMNRFKIMMLINKKSSNGI